MPPASNTTIGYHPKNNTTTGTGSSVFTNAARSPSLNQLPSTSRLTYHLTEDGMTVFGSKGTTTAQPTERRNRPARQETDAGPVLIQDHESQYDILPPGYNPAWTSGASR
ncbi:uncharacterized protein BT62DRAFT_683260 [Guyanagaster necrorhizus]|uniref:Uncharacterized protein n=1 Tax=Guyanagaster necrorhizus TaxID=856835 RepID=A0A9P7VXL5_9AGAR|nr:uncharacterized protein BT62DRAFT_683260 [Guyanagaster necrorhizus MCA 3950]KAG7449416.1 hypothetical protein BT62DRAFT_683260 [Guyanagaster necrorhizus MCA 3950]